MTYIASAWVLVVTSVAASGGDTDGNAAREFAPRRAVQWEVCDWQVENRFFSGNPFDLVADVTFVHEPSGDRRTTPMFHVGGRQWKFRFTGTRPGAWRFVTESPDQDLDGWRGTVAVSPNPAGLGFVRHQDNKWIREGTGRAFVPQYVMFGAPHVYHRKPEIIDEGIQLFLREHGFNGFHVPVFCRWFDINEPKSNRIRGHDPSPDLRTFEALELLLGKVYEAGGVVHIWMWGDDASGQTAEKWGKNGAADRRLQRYIAARLGPIPGWTMGYGFDCYEYADAQLLAGWHGYLNRHFGWRHLLGARNDRKAIREQLSEVLDYSSYESIRPTYDDSSYQPGFGYVQTIDDRKGKPSLCEDRFRVRKGKYAYKDYTEEMTRRGLYHSAMAGGVGNIWGYLIGHDRANHGDAASGPYRHPHWIKTYASFITDRFSGDLIRDPSLTDGACLRNPRSDRLLFYREDTDTILIDLRGMPAPQRVVAIDTLEPYREIDVGFLPPSRQVWRAPRPSDWAIAVGEFGDAE